MQTTAEPAYLLLHFGSFLNQKHTKHSVNCPFIYKADKRQTIIPQSPELSPVPPNGFPTFQENPFLQTSYGGPFNRDARDNTCIPSECFGLYLYPVLLSIWSKLWVRSQFLNPFN